MQNGKQITVKVKTPRKSTKTKDTVSNDGSDYANNIDQCNRDSKSHGRAFVRPHTFFMTLRKSLRFASAN